MTLQYEYDWALKKDTNENIGKISENIPSSYTSTHNIILNYDSTFGK
jgi:hypothetical protein